MKSLSVLVLMQLYDHRIRQGIGRYAAERGWHLTIIDGCTQSRTIPRNWRGHGILTQLWNHADLIKYIRAQTIPCVDMLICRPDIPMSRISGDQRMIGRVAAEHLLERGFRDAAYFSTEFGPLQKLRYEGFAERFMQSTGGKPRNLSWSLQAQGQNDDWNAQRAWLTRSLAEMPKPLGVFCYSDYDGAKVETICLDAKYNIPAEIAIVGVDNDPLVCENLRVPLSSVRHDLFSVGYEGAALLDRLMEGGEPPEEPILIQPKGVEVRASSDSLVSSHPVVQATIDFFSANLGRSVGVDEAAEAVGWPAYKLKRLFKEETNDSIYALLIKLRLLTVKRLLKRSDLSIREIAEQTGFCHAQHLSNLFRRLVGVTPTEYREQEREATHKWW